MLQLESLNDPVVLSVVGGVLGVTRGLIAGQRKGWLNSISGAAIGVASAAAIADWLTPANYAFVALLVGMVAGATGARALDAIHDLAPELVQKLGRGAVDKVLDMIGANSKVQK